MKRVWLLIAIIWLGLLSIAMASPKIQVDQKEWDYGNVCRGAALRHSYWVKNVGDSTLNIIKVRPG